MKRYLLAAAILFLSPPGCRERHHGECRNGRCACPPGERCDLVCTAPPCDLLCAGDNPECNGECANGSCICAPQSRCAFWCAAPPCHVECDPDTDCSGECANGECTCGSGSTCRFECLTSPCHVTCAGNNPECTGECGNGTCRCGESSTCHFSCRDDPCSIRCDSGAACVLDCAPGTPGRSCTFDTCWEGQPVLCPDGRTVTCGSPCPPRQPSP